MSFLLTIAGLTLAGLALLRLFRLGSGHVTVDLALAWFVGGGWFSLAVAGLRFLAGFSYSAPLALCVLAAPPAAWFAAFVRRPRAALAHGESAPKATARWGPRPLWLFGPIAIYILVVVYAVTAHGINSPTQTDDGVRVRAQTPLLAFADQWNAEARQLLPVAGSVPTWVPSLAWRLTGRVDQFHVNYAVLTSFACLIVLVVGLASSRGRPEHGWAGAFAILSLPLFVFHCTSTYTDAILAIHVAAGFVFFVEYQRTHDRADAARALLMFVVATLVKREGALAAACAAAPLLILLAWRSRSGEPLRLRRFSLLVLPLLVDLGTRIAAVGTSGAFPILNLLTRPSASAPASDPVTGELHERAAAAFCQSVFRSGNQGMLYWILAATIVARLPALLRAGHALTLLSVAGLFALTAASSVWLIPEYTLDNSTVHRALLVVSVPAALWVATTLTDWVVEEGCPLPAPA